ncbi:hypothetical protein [Arthrobacter rhombi]|uniref:hypothetical protein n=1 Tax=Arthrobacter rhombi TaxID=71253 RepID=UPI003FD1E3D5
MTTNQTGPTLQQLVLDNKGELSYGSLADRSGGALKPRGLQKLVTTQFSSFPSPETLQGISRALGLPLREVVLAAGRSLGLRLHDANPDDLVLVGAGQLPLSSRDALRSMSREMLNWREGKYDTAEDGAALDNVTTMPTRNWDNMAADSQAGQVDDGHVIGHDQEPEGP